MFLDVNLKRYKMTCHCFQIAFNVQSESGANDGCENEIFFSTDQYECLKHRNSFQSNEYLENSGGKALQTINLSLYETPYQFASYVSSNGIDSPTPKSLIM